MTAFKPTFNQRSLLLIITLALLVPAANVCGQVYGEVTVGPDEVFMLPELGALIGVSPNGLMIVMVMPEAHRAEAYKKVDLQKGDFIKMVNGKGVKTCGDLRAAYEALKVGDELKLGIKRDKGLMIVSLSKANADDLPAQMIMTTSEIGSSDVAAALIDAGILLDEKDGIITVGDYIGAIPVKFEGAKPAKGDILLKIQGEKVEGPDSIKQLWSKVEPGTKAELTFDRGGREITVRFLRQSASIQTETRTIVK